MGGDASQSSLCWLLLRHSCAHYARTHACRQITHAQKHTHTHATNHTCTHVQKHTHMTHMYTHSHALTITHADVQTTHTHTQALTYMLTHRHAHTRIHTRTHIHTHTNMHTYTQCVQQFPTGVIARRQEVSPRSAKLQARLRMNSSPADTLRSISS